MAAEPKTRDAVALIVADDLTGACDAGVHFAARGLRTQAPIGEESYARCGAAVIALNTDTRSSGGSAVALQLEPVLEQARARKPQILMKKIDSTLRGPVEIEIAWMLERLGLRMAVLAPAFPGAGRVAREGRVEIRGSELVVDIAACFPALECAHVRREEIVALGGRISEEMERGTQVLIVDAESDADLEQIARAQRTGAEVLWAGSGGLARALAAQVGPELRSTSRLEAGGPVLACVGSDHSATVEQLWRLEQELMVVRVRADEAGLAAARRALERGTDAVIELTREQMERAPDSALGGRAGVRHCGSMIVTGGDTARHVLRSLGAEMLELRNELEPGIPWGEVCGGEADGKVVVTKSGGFGGGDSLLKCVERLHPMAARRQRAEAL